MGKSSNRFYIDIMALHEEVTGSCFLNVIKFPDGTSKKIVIDCGLFQETEYTSLNASLPFSAENIDYVIVTHNHVDHTGRLPLLVKQGFNGQIYMSHDTKSLISNALIDSFKVLRKKSIQFNEPLLYTEEDVYKTLALTKGYSYEETIWLDENIKITFFMNGHLPGASIILLQAHYHGNSKNQYYKDINVLFTGDYSNKNMFFDVKPIPKWVHKLPINIVQEATYGDMDTTDIDYVFENNILSAIENNKEIVIPVFSLGRSQEIMFILKKWQDEGKLDKNIPIFFDGKLGMRYTKLFTSNVIKIKEECKNFLPENLTFVTSDSIRQAIMKDFDCKIILTTSGMGSHGPAQTYLPVFLKKSNALIHFTGYVAEGTLGRKLYNASKNSVVEIAGLKVKKVADVQFTSEFSAHAKANELIEFLKQFINIKMVLINHGNNDVKDSYSERVINEVSPKDVSVLSRDFYLRLDGYGYVKQLSSKFN